MTDFAQTTLVNTGNDDRSFIVGSGEISSPIPEPVVQQSYAVSVTSSNEGGDVIVTVNTTGVSNNTLMYLTIATNSSVALGDFYDSTWNVNIYNNVGKLKLHVKKDKLIEGTENIILQLRVGSSRGTVVATSNSASILDTVIAAVPTMPVAPPITPMPINPTIPSLGTPSYTITISPSTLRENTANILNINTINVLDGTPLFITVGGLGTATVNDFIGYPLRTTVANGKASRSVYSIVDAIIETETVQFELRTDNFGGTVVAASNVITLIDQSFNGGGGTAIAAIDSVAINSNPYGSTFPTGMSFTVTYQAMYDTGSMLTDYEIISEDGVTIYRAGTVAVNNTSHTSTFYWLQAEQIADRGYSTSYYRCRIRRRSADSLITAEWSSFIGNISV